MSWRKSWRKLAALSKLNKKSPILLNKMRLGNKNGADYRT